MTIHTVDFHRVARLAIQPAVAVIVLPEVAVDALHAFFEVDVLEVHGLAEAIGIVVRDDVVVRVEKIPAAIALVHGAVDPAMTVKIRKLRVPELRVEFGGPDLPEECRVAPFPLERRLLRIAAANLELFCFRASLLLRRIHLLAVGLVLPPRIAVVGGDHVRAWMHVTGHALARGDRPRERVLQRVPGFEAFWIDRRVGRFRTAVVAKLRVLCSMFRRTVVRIDDMAARAAAAAIVARLIVRAGKREERIEQPRLLKAEKNRISTEPGAKAAVAQLHVGPARLLVLRRIANLAFLPAAALEYSQYVAGLRDFPSRKRVQ